MIKRIIAAAAMARIEALEAKIAKLVGNPYDRGEVSMADYIIANERGDKVTVQRYTDQFKKGGCLEGKTWK